jgi:hypothetical protein
MLTRAIVVALAVGAAIAPLPPHEVERWYSQGWYRQLQAVATPLSNLVPIALFDVALAALLVTGLAVFVRRVRKHGLVRGTVATAGSALVASAVLYLLFLALWGLNYRRVPLDQKVDYESARVTRDRALAFAGDAVSHVNAGYSAAHDARWDTAALERAFAGAERALGAIHPAVTGVPKHSLLTLYFRRAAIDGMTDPYFLEVIVNPDVLPFERPFVLAHEWAHLSGYADEAEANFVSWLACVRGDPLARYSGWLAAYEHALDALSRDDRRTVPPLDPGPRADVRAMAERYNRASPVVRAAARDAYDKYLRANRVPEGIARYGAVVRLMLGTRFDSEGNPTLR